MSNLLESEENKYIYIYKYISICFDSVSFSRGLMDCPFSKTVLMKYVCEPLKFIGFQFHQITKFPDKGINIASMFY